MAKEGTLKTTPGTIIGKAIRDARVARGLTQGVVSELIGRTDGTVAAYEAGFLVPPGDTLLRLGLALKIDLDAVAARLLSQDRQQRRAAAAA